MKYVIGNRAYATKTAEVSAALNEAHTITWPGQIEDGESVFILRNQGEFQAWARSVPQAVAEQIGQTDELVRKAQELENADNETAIFWQNLLVKRISSDIQG